ncbi:MAG: CHAP domain-containing protein [Actinomycetota bacterium]|nr:CHAP domain-containing protein [Actinomycetota bacterium]
MRLLRRGCGCMGMLLAFAVALPLAVVSCDGGAAAAGSANNLGGSGPVGQAREMTWTALFPWTPPGGEAGASSWPSGQCTWFVVSEGHATGDHRVSWSGDAWQWYANAAAIGVTTELPSVVPKAGWIAVYARGHGSDASAGHVAVVVDVSPSAYTIAEANVLGLGVVDERTLPLPGTPADTARPLLEGWIP